MSMTVKIFFWNNRLSKTLCSLPARQTRSHIGGLGVQSPITRAIVRVGQGTLEKQKARTRRASLAVCGGLLLLAQPTFEFLRNIQVWRANSPFTFAVNNIRHVDCFSRSFVDHSARFEFNSALHFGYVFHFDFPLVLLDQAARYCAARFGIAGLLCQRDYASLPPFKRFIWNTCPYAGVSYAVVWHKRNAASVFGKSPLDFIRCVISARAV